MPRNRHAVKHIITKLCETEVALSKKQSVVQVYWTPGITDPYFRWRNEYGGLKIDQAKRLKELEREITGLQRAVAGLTLDRLILKETTEARGSSRKGTKTSCSIRASISTA